MKKILLLSILLQFLFFSPIAYCQNNLYSKGEVLAGNMYASEGDYTLIFDSIYDGYNGKKFFIAFHEEIYSHESRVYNITNVSLFLIEDNKYEFIDYWSSGVGAFRFEAPIMFHYNGDKFLRISRYIPGNGNFDESILFYIDKNNELKEIEQIDMYQYLRPMLNDNEKLYHRGGDYNTYEDDDLRFNVVFNYNGIRCLGCFSGTYKIIDTENGNKEMIVDEYKKTIDSITAKAFYLTVEGEGLYRMGKYQEAIRNFQKAIEIEEQYARAYSNLGIAYIRTEDYKKAIRMNEKAISCSNSDTITASSYYNIALAYEKKEDWEKALSNYKNALDYRNHPLYRDGIERMKVRIGVN